MGNVHWTEQEKQGLKKFYPKVPMPKLVAMFPGRTEQAVRALASRMGLKKTKKARGVHHRRATFYGRPEMVERIRVEYDEGNVTLAELGEKYSISAVLAFDIVSGKRYPECGGPISDARHLSDGEILAMREERRTTRLKELAERYDISESMASRVCLGRRHKEKPGPIVDKPYRIIIREE